jgi:hypothetical protein
MTHKAGCQWRNAENSQIKSETLLIKWKLGTEEQSYRIRTAESTVDIFHPAIAKSK